MGEGNSLRDLRYEPPYSARAAIPGHPFAHATCRGCVDMAIFIRALAPVEHPIWKKLVRSEETPVRHSDRREITWIIGHKHSESLVEPSWDCAAQKANEPHSVVEFDMREFVRGNDLVNATRSKKDLPRV